jgi:uncharacterized damage-inducible protein DinB
MKRLLVALALVVLAAAPAAAQDMHADHGRAAISAVENQWNSITGYILQVAQETEEADYGYRPTEDVRSIGEMIGHVAGAQYMICAAAIGDEPRAEDAVEEAAKTKDALVKELQSSMEYCEKAYAKSDMALQNDVSLFGMDMTGFGALVLNTTHNGEHYGNLVTYLRMRGTVPPSSRGGM